ncbi:MAG: hypothetical protein HDP28_00155 [Clostridia bacterium]|nr:hypothetical protein [Clostridia bacterium]
MKKKLLALALSSVTLAVSCGALAACDGETQYNVIKSNKDYTFEHYKSSNAVLDEEVTLDGEFTEDFYTGRNWFYGKKRLGQVTADVKLTTYTGKNGIYLAAHVEESTIVYYNAAKISSWNSGLEFYFAFGEANTWQDGFYEITATAGEQLDVRRAEISAGGSFRNMALTRETTPQIAVKRVGDLLGETCQEYQFEIFLPYSLLGRTTRPDTVNIDVCHHAATSAALKNERDRYDFGGNELSFYGWLNPKGGYTFNANGFVSNKLAISATGGGTVAESHGNDYAVTGDIVDFMITPESGKKLAKVEVENAGVTQDLTASVQNGKLSVVCKGNMSVRATFTDEN